MFAYLCFKNARNRYNKCFITFSESLTYHITLHMQSFSQKQQRTSKLSTKNTMSMSVRPTTLVSFEKDPHDTIRVTRNGNLFNTNSSSILRTRLQRASYDCGGVVFFAFRTSNASLIDEYREVPEITDTQM